MSDFLRYRVTFCDSCDFLRWLMFLTIFNSPRTVVRLYLKVKVVDRTFFRRTSSLMQEGIIQQAKQSIDYLFDRLFARSTLLQNWFSDDVLRKESQHEGNLKHNIHNLSRFTIKYFYGKYLEARMSWSVRVGTYPFFSQLNRCCMLLFLMRFAFRSKPLKERNICRWHPSPNPIKRLNKHCCVNIFSFERINAWLKGNERYPFFDRLFWTEFHRSLISKNTIDRLISAESRRSIAIFASWKVI